MQFPLAIFLPLLLFPLATPAGVVINEIFYNGPDELEDLEYIELHNSGDQPADVSGWKFTKGIEFAFGEGVRIEAGGFLLLCQNRDRFQEYFQVPVAGTFDRKLSNKGERLELSDAAGKVIDSVKYRDSAPWPMGADGYSGSLERISPAAGGEDAYNWVSSPLSENRSRPAGTPGLPNAAYSAQLPPAITEVSFHPKIPAANQPVEVQARLRQGEEAAEVRLLYRIAGAGREETEVSLRMKAAADGHFQALIPGQTAGQLIRFRVQAIGSQGAKRYFPAATEPRPALSSFVQPEFEPAKIPIAWIIQTNPEQARAASERAQTAGRGGFRPPFSPEEMARMRAQRMAETMLDLPAAWLALTVPTGSFDTWQKAKPIFAAKITDRSKLIDDLAEAQNPQARLESLPEISRAFFQELAQSLNAALSDEEVKPFADWLEKHTSETSNAPAGMPGPEVMLKIRLNLEQAWFELSFQDSIEEAQFAQTQQAFKETLEKREQLAQRVASVASGEDFFAMMEETQPLGEKLRKDLEALLSASQAQLLADRMNTGPFGGFRFGRPGGPPNSPRRVEAEREEPGRRFGRGGPGGPRGPGRFRSGPPQPASNDSALVYWDPESQELQLFDFVEVAPRSGGQKVRFHKDQTLREMSTINLIFEYNEKFVLAEPLAYEVYRRAGMAAEQSFHVRLFQNGQPLGYHLLVEQPNRAFLRRHDLNDEGNLYKILWYERGVVGQHEKKTNARYGHDDIIWIVDALEKSEGQEQWEVIRRHFDVEQVATYFAVNMVLSHWDGFFNNYFTYHDVHGSGKWTMYPWDQDQTWGIAMGSGNVFYDMPLTFGMTGDQPPGRAASPQSPERGRGFGFGRGGAPWWRGPGYFSGPLLANPTFRALFLARTRQILETHYTEEVFHPIINAMGERLKPEVRFRAELLNRDPDRELQTLERHLQELRDHVRLRREFLLAQEEIKNAASSAGMPRGGRQ